MYLNLFKYFMIHKSFDCTQDFTFRHVLHELTMNCKNKNGMKTKQNNKWSEHKSIFHILNGICCSQFSPRALGAIMTTLWSKLVGSEKGYFVSKSIEWEGHTGQSCIYCSKKNHVSFIQVNSTDIFCFTASLFSPHSHQSLLVGLKTR